MPEPSEFKQGIRAEPDLGVWEACTRVKGRTGFHKVWVLWLPQQFQGE
jgi:hypothetical protein